jgi:hypothetical protein
VGLRLVLECDACGETAQVAVSHNPAPTPQDFLDEEDSTGRGILGALETQGWRLQVVRGIVVAACCPAHFAEASRRLKGELALRKAARDESKVRCRHCGKTMLEVVGLLACPHCGEAP